MKACSLSGPGPRLTSMDGVKAIRGWWAPRDWLSRNRGFVVVVMGLALVALISAALWAGPGAVVGHDLAGASITPQEKLTALNNVRTTLLSSVGGAVVLFGAYSAWRQLRVSQDGLRATQEGYLTDRFSKAVDQLGSEKPAVRIGGLHALWRIAEYSARDRDAVISILAAYLRMHTSWPPTDSDFPAELSINSVPPLEHGHRMPKRR